MMMQTNKQEKRKEIHHEQQYMYMERKVKEEAKE
jgi:hypothetical protein